MGAGASSNAAGKQASSHRGRPRGRPARESRATGDETGRRAPSRAHEEAPPASAHESRGQADEVEVGGEARLEYATPERALGDTPERPVGLDAQCVGGEEKEALLEGMGEMRADGGTGAGGKGHEPNASAVASTSGRNLARMFWRGGPRGPSGAGSSRRFLRSASGAASNAGAPLDSTAKVRGGGVRRRGQRQNGSFVPRTLTGIGLLLPRQSSCS